MGIILYLAAKIGPDLGVSASMLVRFMEAPAQRHMRAAKLAFRHSKEAGKYTLLLFPGTKTQLHESVEVNWFGDKFSKQRSRTGVFIRYGDERLYAFNCLQKYITLTATEVEYMALSETASNVSWLLQVLKELGARQQSATPYQDN